MAKQPPGDLSIGKFDILATYAYAYAKALLDGLNDDEVEQRGMVAAIMGAQARLGIRKSATRNSEPRERRPVVGRQEAGKD